MGADLAWQQLLKPRQIREVNKSVCCLSERWLLRKTNDEIGLQKDYIGNGDRNKLLSGAWIGLLSSAHACLKKGCCDLPGKV